MENSPCCYSVTADQIGTHYYTCHDSTVAVSRKQFNKDHFV